MNPLDLLGAHGALQLLVTGVVGLMVGSFLNVVIHRVPRRMEAEWQAQCAELDGREPAAAHAPGIVWPPSACPHCQRRIAAWENIPLVSYLLLRGRCSGCGTAISPRYPVVEAATAVMALVVVWHFGWGVHAAAAAAFTAVLIALTVIDLEHMLLPDSLTLPLLWLGLLLSLGEVFVAPETAIIGAAAGYLSLWAVYHVFRLITGKEGMGHGDFKLLAALGAWLGWPALPLVIILASGVGAVVGVAMIAGLGRGRDYPIPFGPYLAAAGWIALLWGDAIVAGYASFAGLD